MLHRIKTIALLASAVALGLSSAACSALTQPEEITISAEPLPGRAQPAAPTAPGGLALPAMPAMPAAPAQGG